MDGTTLDVPDTPANVAVFGQPPASRGASAFPQVRVVALGECGTHAMFAATIGPYATGETTLAWQLLDSGLLGAGMLLLADRGFVGFDLWRAAQATGWCCGQDRPRGWSRSCGECCWSTMPSAG